MKILVTAKSVPDPDQPLAIAASRRGLDSNGTSYILNPFDAIAVEQAVRMRENGADIDEIVVVGIGGPECEKTLRSALAVGADRAVFVEVERSLDPWAVTRVVEAIEANEKSDLILMGKQAVDDDSNQVGQFLAARLARPQATFASKITMKSMAVLIVERESDHGIETLELSLPAVVTCDLRLNEPRYASLPAIMKAKRKPMDRTDLQALGVDAVRRIEIVGLETADSKRQCQFVETVDELISKLREEAKVIS